MGKLMFVLCVVIVFNHSLQDYSTGMDDFKPDLIYDDGDQSRLNESGPSDSVIGSVRLLYRLTDPNHYDRNERPLLGQGPVNVTARTYVYVMSSIEGRLHMQLKMNMKMQLSYQDPRLRFSHIVGAPTEVSGDASLLDRLWTPHIFLANERRSFVMGTGLKDVLIRVLSTGQVFFITRFSATVVCTMKAGRFPFDQQDCPLLLESWIDESDELVLSWAPGPVGVNDEFSAATFAITDIEHTEELVTREHLHQDVYNPNDQEAQYWSLRLNFSLARLHGFFIMDYYLPSILLVVISWVSFWLDPCMIPARVLLGSSTMLTFIMLAVQTDKAPPSSYVKASEIWFLGCTSFIFGSLVEFAFVNTIWRKGENVRLKKVNTRHILKSTLSTPRPQREPLTARERYARRRTSSLPDLNAAAAAAAAAENARSRESQLGRFQIRPAARLSPRDRDSDPSYLQTLPPGSVFRRPSTLSVVEEMDMDMEDDIDIAPTMSSLDGDETFWRRFLCKPCRAGRQWGSSVTFGWTQMSAKEVAAWIDKRSRVFFPVAFFAFNIFYWAFVSFF